jgi:hypothetical protein
MTSGFIGIALNFIRSALGATAANQGQQQHSPKQGAAPNPNGWEVWFEESGRDGKVGFKGEGHRFGMYWEFGGGDVVAIINVPSADKWVEKTGIALGKRQKILDFIGTETVRQKISTKGHFKIEENSIFIYA